MKTFLDEWSSPQHYKQFSLIILNAHRSLWQNTYSPRLALNLESLPSIVDDLENLRIIRLNSHHESVFTLKIDQI